MMTVVLKILDVSRYALQVTTLLKTIIIIFSWTATEILFDEGKKDKLDFYTMWLRRYRES